MGEKARLVAFALRDTDEQLSGGTVSYGDGETFDVAAALDEGNGTIVVNEDSHEHHALAGYPALKSVPVPDGATPVDGSDESAGSARASRAAADKAAQLGVDLSEVEGTGAGGNVTVADVEKAAEGGES